MRRLSAFLILSVLASVLVLPGSAAAAGYIGALTIAPNWVWDGATTEGTVTLQYPDTVDNTVVIFSGDTSVATVPGTTVIPAGATSVTFPIATNASAPETIVQITAAVSGIPRSAYLTVNAATPSGPSLSGLSITPTSIVAGQNATATATFTGALRDGTVVRFTSSDPTVAQVPTQASLSANRSSTTFNLATSAVTAPTTVTITASWYVITRTATITVAPGTPPPADIVRITKAQYNKSRILTIEATGSDPNAILSVYSAGGGFLFSLTNNGNGRHSDQRGWRTSAPEQITVRSNFGGTAESVVARV
ncbi:hypothetical protein ACFP2T_06290 [Plantactinospora solaniradicis]|uniref:Uncharacterized protein n=1 Tax=Plantactinospora solaniradicis TaxID=1723736 RepID=A0ABW1K225_9ACTN